MRISYKRFLEELRSLPQKFEIDLNGAIREKKVHHNCPYLSVGHKLTSNNQGITVTLNAEDINHNIFKAADNSLLHSVRIRKDLLKACKLEAK